MPQATSSIRVDRPQASARGRRARRARIVAVAVDPAGDRLAERLGLLVDLLEHEVLVAALLGGLGRPVDRSSTGRSTGRPSTSVIVDAPTAGGRRRRPPRGRRSGSVWARIAATSLARKLLAVAEADDERHVLAGPDEPVALGPVHHDDRVGALGPGAGPPGRRRRGRRRRPPRRGGRAPRCRSRRSACGRAPRARRAARGSSR